MSVILTEAMEARIIEVTVSSKLTQEAYRALISGAETALQKHETIRVLFLILGFQGWNAGLLWRDAHLQPKRFDRIERLAIVGESKWENGMSDFCQPFTKADIRYFDLSDLEESRRWLTSFSI